MPEQHEISHLVTAVLHGWQQAGISCLILRNNEDLPDLAADSLEVLVEPGELRLAERALLRAAAQDGFRLHSRIESSTLALYFSSRQSNVQARFELLTGLRWGGVEFLPCEGFLWRKRDRGFYSVPHRADETAFKLLASLICTGKVEEKDKAAIAAGLQAEAEAITSLLARIYGPVHAGFLVKAGAQERWAEIEAAAAALRRALIRRQLAAHPWRTLKSLLGSARRLAGCFVRPPGVTVVLCGADGSGKSTAAAALLKGLGVTFGPQKTHHFHWKPPLFSTRRRAARSPATDPHGRLPRNPLLSLGYFGFHWLEFWLGSHLRLRPMTARGGLVLIDRFYYDFFVDQRRYRLRVPPALVRMGYWLLKKPDLVVLLDAPAEVLQRRKQEVSLAETERQRAAYLALVRRLRHGRVVDATQPPEKVGADISRTILDFMADRIQQRRAAGNP